MKQQAIVSMDDTACAGIVVENITDIDGDKYYD